ncbi:MAG: chorismate mutase [Nanoarchaeota archaeon]
MDSIEHYRKKIDDVDRNIVKLLTLRLDLAKRIGSYKKTNKIGIIDKKRELRIIRNIKRNLNKSNKNFIIAIFKNIIHYSKRAQSK